MKSFDAPTHGLRNFLTIAILAVLVALAVAFSRGGPPAIDTGTLPAAVGAHRAVDINVRDSMGVRQVRAFYRQSGRELPIVVQQMGERRNWFFASAGARQAVVNLQIGKRDVSGLNDGAAQLVIEATAANLRGSMARVEHPLTIRSVPPQIAALTTQHYIHQGGCDMVVYRVSEGANRSGVSMGGEFFPGHALPGAAPGTMFCIFAFPYNAAPNAVPRLTANDEAGNETSTGMAVKTFPHGYPSRPFNISDDFIARVVPPILSNSPEVADQHDPLKNFLAANHDLRLINAAKLVELSRQSRPEFLWHGAFAQLGNSAVEAHFADHRVYLYHGQRIDEEDHLGYDLAAVAHTPVLAANSGRVLFDGYLGIYGNTVILDHGFGLLSLYAHLNDFAVKSGDSVRGGQLLGHSDSTGMAGGDHVHFSMLLDGVQVDPKEWWDPHWIHDRVQAKFEQFGQPAAGSGR